ncbi:DedA family protein [Actinocorallia longicatena]|uniref:VTT domain-containing protein n=1 Tax=Actinocorallia longicatena TaxID=111803 RepID=A0ABP6QPY2_9ACTN
MTAWMAAHMGMAGVWGALILVLLAPALEAALPLVGVVVPGQTAVVVGGILAYHGRVSVTGILVAAVVGAVAGNLIGYAAGRRWGGGLMARVPRRMRSARHTEKALKMIARNSGKAVFVGRFTAVVRTLVPTLCGMNGIPIRRFMVWTTVSSAIWAPVFVAIGFAAAPGLPV